jgi:hypothetical protein
VTRPDRLARLPLRAELYLVAHDDDRGTAHIHPRVLAVGLAGAVLLELWLAGRVYPGWRFDPATARWMPGPGQLAVVVPHPLGDPLSDAALAAVRSVRRSAQPEHQLRDWLRQFAFTDPYERVRADMVAAGVLRRTSRRRYGMLARDRYLATDDAWAVRARARARSAATTATAATAATAAPDRQCTALCGLVDVLELVPYLYSPELTAGRFRRWLDRTLREEDLAIREVVKAIDASRGDLAVTAR